MSAVLTRESLPSPWQERVVLDDGRPLWLRPIVPDDAAALTAGFALLTPDEVRMRFLHPLKELPPELLQRLVNPRPRREFALVAAEPLPPGEALVGAVVRACIDEDGRRAEFAILVARLLTGQGLGTMLMKRVIRWARLKKLDAIYGDVLDENDAMLRLAQSLGFKREVLADEPGLLRVTLPLKPVVAA